MCIRDRYYAGDGFNYELAGNIGMAPVEDMYLNLTVQHKVKDYSFRGDVDPRVSPALASGATLLSRFPGVLNAKDYPYVNRIFGDGRMALTNVFYNMGYTCLLYTSRCV